jgi:hypothetical protein
VVPAHLLAELDFSKRLGRDVHGAIVVPSGRPLADGGSEGLNQCDKEAVQPGIPGGEEPR